MSEICEAVLDRLYELLHERQVEEDRDLQELRFHLLGCASCQRELTDLRGFLAASEEALGFLPDSVEAGLNARTQVGIDHLLERLHASAEPKLVRLGRVPPEKRLALLKEAALRLVGRLAPHEAGMMSTLWQLAVAQRGRGGGAGGFAPALGAVGQREGSLTSSQLISAALSLYDLSETASGSGPSPHDGAALQAELLAEIQLD